MKLSDLGFDPWFETHATELSQDGCRFARVAAVDRGSYLIRDESGEGPSRIGGKLSYRTDSSVDLPCVGDWVTAQYHSNDAAAIIHRVFPRKDVPAAQEPRQECRFPDDCRQHRCRFHRPVLPFRLQPQPVGALLIMAADGQVEPVVILTKTDLVTPEELEQKLTLHPLRHPGQK